jgi:hypothetical protein
MNDHHDHDLLKAELKALHSSHELEHGLERLAQKLAGTNVMVRERAERARQTAIWVRDLAVPAALAGTVLAGLFAIVSIALRRRRERADLRLDYVSAAAEAEKHRRTLGVYDVDAA